MGEDDEDDDDSTPKQVGLQVVTRLLITGSIAHSASRRYIIYSETDFEVFAPQGRHVAPMGLRSPPPCQISPPSVQRQGCRTPKPKFLLRFDQNVEYKRPAGAYSLKLFSQNLQNIYLISGCVRC